jgi:RNA polymerase sigma-70 factor (ECF subfamily)
MDGVAEDLGGLAGLAVLREDARLDFASVIERNAGVMYRVAYSLVRNAEDAEDVVQETLLKLHRTGGWLGMVEERGFLARAVWRVGLTRHGSTGAKAMRRAADVTELELSSGRPSPEDDAVDAAERRLLHELMDELAEPFRQALVLSAIDGLRAKDVAEMLGVEEGTVRTRVLRAKTELRRLFLERKGGRR